MRNPSFETIVLASGNAGKLAELRSLLEPLVIKVVAQSDCGITGAAETAHSFLENALAKARHAAGQSGLPAIADDSGLCVDALDGGPGVYSARYAGDGGDAQANNAQLLAALAGVAEAGRGAHFHCTVVFLRGADDPAPLVAQGDWYGRILTAPRGCAGFGYDPLFWVANEKASAAELAPERKNAISHRGQALRELAQKIGDGHWIPVRRGHGVRNDGPGTESAERQC